MSKRRNKTKLRPHELTDEDMEALEKPDADAPEAPPRPAQRPAQHPVSPEMAGRYCEGMLVYVPDKRKINLDGVPFQTGTIVHICGGEAWVLDSAGIIHVAKLGELGAA